MMLAGPAGRGEATASQAGLLPEPPSRSRAASRRAPSDRQRQRLAAAFPISGSRAPQPASRYRCRSANPLLSHRNARSSNTTFPVRARRERATTEAAERSIEHARAGIEGGGGVRNPHAAGVVQVNADRLCARDLHRSRGQFADLLRPGIADRVGDRNHVDAGLEQFFPSAASTSFGSTAPTIEQPSATEIAEFTTGLCALASRSSTEPFDVGDG